LGSLLGANNLAAQSVAKYTGNTSTNPTQST
jgi:hypothetical protein